MFHKRSLLDIQDHYAQTYAQFSWICITFLHINLMVLGFCERILHYFNFKLRLYVTVTLPKRRKKG